MSTGWYLHIWSFLWNDSIAALIWALRQVSTDRFHTVLQIYSTRSTLRAASNGDYVVPRTRLKFGERAFSVAAPPAWNRLPTELKLSSTPAFKRSLKTFFFQTAYCTNHTNLDNVMRRRSSNLVVGGALNQLLIWFEFWQSILPHVTWPKSTNRVRIIPWHDNIYLNVTCLHRHDCVLVLRHGGLFTRIYRSFLCTSFQSSATSAFCCSSSACFLDLFHLQLLFRCRTLFLTPSTWHWTALAGNFLSFIFFVFYYYYYYYYYWLVVPWFSSRLRRYTNYLLTYLLTTSSYNNNN